MCHFKQRGFPDYCCLRFRLNFFLRSVKSFCELVQSLTLASMDNTAVLNNLLPICCTTSYCECFQKLFKKPNHYNPKDVLQYTSFSQRELQKYQNEIRKHLEKDRLFNQEGYSNVPAKEVKCANDHFLETVRKFLLYQCQTQDKGDFYCNYYSQIVKLQNLLSLYENIGTTTEKSVLLFNQPDTLLPIKNLIDTLDIHQTCIYVFQQYFHIYNFGVANTTKIYYNPKVHSFYFKQEE